jgi:single stranded DNA-binding protein
MNSVHLIGNLATEVELRDVGEEKKVASFLLAVGRGSRDGSADFVWISAWERQGELCAEYLAKGNKVAVDGRLKTGRGKRRASGATPSRSSPAASSSSLRPTARKERR